MKDPKTAPCNADAEAAVLGSLLIDASMAIEALQAEDFADDDFYLQKHRWIIAAARDIYHREETVDFLTLSSELDKRGQLEAAGGAVYLSQLINYVPSAINIRSYIRIVKEAAVRRQMLDMVSDIARVAYNEQMSINEAGDYVQRRMAALLTQTSTAPKTYQNFAAIAATLQPVQWLWPFWIPKGMLTLLGAIPGAGKSLVGLDMAKRVINGDTFPDGGRNTWGPQNVIYIDAEMIPQLLKERAVSWRVNLERLYLMLPNPNDMIDFGRLEYREKLRNMVATLKPGLIIVDSLSSVSSRGENNVEDIRTVMGFLNEIVNVYQTSMIIIHHLRKRSGGPQMSLPGFSDLTPDDFRGSSHIIAMSRSVLGLSVVQTGAESNRNGPRKLEVLKTNLCAYPDAIGCELMPMHPTGIFLKWSDEAPQPYKEPSKFDQCAEWLAILLKGQDPLSPKEIIELAKEEGFSQATVYRARKTLPNIVDTEGRQAPTNKWEWH